MERKQEVLHVHELLAEILKHVGGDFGDEQLSKDELDYFDQGTQYIDLSANRKEHEFATLTLGADLARELSENKEYEPSLEAFKRFIEDPEVDTVLPQGLEEEAVAETV